MKNEKNENSNFELKQKIADYKSGLETLSKEFDCKYDEVAGTLIVKFNKKQLMVITIDDEDDIELGLLLSRSLHNEMKIEDLKKIRANYMVESNVDDTDLFMILFNHELDSMIVETRMFMPPFSLAKKAILTEYLENNKNVKPKDVNDPWVTSNNDGLEEFAKPRIIDKKHPQGLYYPVGDIDIFIEILHPTTLGELIKEVDNHIQGIYKVLD